MHISRIAVSNYRNFEDLNVELIQHVVILGSNKVGKTNLIRALRLAIDPNLPPSARRLQNADFFDGMNHKPFDGRTINVEVELALEDQDVTPMSRLGALLGDGKTARFTYRFELDPLKRVAAEISTPENSEVVFQPIDYQFNWFAGLESASSTQVNQNTLSNYISFRMLDALRDTEDLLSNWSRSPLRTLLENANIDREFLVRTAQEIRRTAEPLTTRDEFVEIIENVENRSQGMVGDIFNVGSTLGIVTDEPDELLKAFKLYTDGNKQRPLSQASLGTLNVLYLSLLLEEMQQKQRLRKKLQQERENKRKAKQATHPSTTVNNGTEIFEQHVILAVEEPEAHVHPHVQRSIFKYFLSKDSAIQSLLVTTHSPHIASVLTDLNSLVVLREPKGSTGTKAFRISSGLFDNQEQSDLLRYLDVTKAELLFSRGVVFVEGTAEQFLVPSFAKTLDINLDYLGVSVVAVQGTDFAPYVKLVSHKGLNIPFVVITDGDRGNVLEETEDDQEADEYTGDYVDSPGLRRGWKLAKNILQKQTIEDKSSLEESGIFVGDVTLEIDLLSYYETEMLQTYESLDASKRQSLAFQRDILSAKAGDYKPLLRRISYKGKGRFAQRLAGYIVTGKCPKYIESALRSICSQVANSSD